MEIVLNVWIIVFNVILNKMFVRNALILLNWLKILLVLIINSFRFRLMIKAIWYWRKVRLRK